MTGDANRTAETQRRTPMIVIGPIRATGATAYLVALLFLAGTVALIVHYRARIVSSPLTISALLWIAFITYWNVAATNTARTVRSESARSRSVHQYLMVASLVLLFAPLPLLDRRILPIGALWVPLGLAVHAGSFAFALAARRTLGRNWSGAVTEKEDHQLVQSGPYRIVRHPIYTAMIGMFVGTALVSGDLHAFLGAGLIVVAYARKLKIEERNLDVVFGARYAEYRRTTRAIIPWVF